MSYMVSFEIATLAISGYMKHSRVILLDIDVDVRKSFCKILFREMGEDNTDQLPIVGNTGTNVLRFIQSQFAFRIDGGG